MITNYINQNVQLKKDDVKGILAKSKITKDTIILVEKAVEQSSRPINAASNPKLVVD
jgi:hypothetical protein